VCSAVKSKGDVLKAAGHTRARKETETVSFTRIKIARLVLRNAPELADAVLTGGNS
jgi:hypothetical protein